jgi:hypothetical protein
VTEWAWWYPVLAVVAVAVGISFVARGASCRGAASRAVCWAHAVMASAMAVMFSPWPSLVPDLAGIVAFTLIAAWFVAHRLRTGPDGGEAAHVAVGSAAMVVMYLGKSSQASTAEAPAGHAGHLAAASGPSSLLPVVVGLALTGYFAWHAWESTSRPRQAAPADGPGGTATLSRVRTETAAHVALDVLMAVMFLGML